jgi:DNA-binding transcriptional LysR family regulator
LTSIELRHLRYFLAVFEELHFGRAAVRLRITQPPLSSAIRTLEHELGVQLFERNKRAVVPTGAGQALAARAREVLAGLDRAVNEARRAGGPGMPLRVGCSPYLPMDDIQRFLVALRDRQPGALQLTHTIATEQIRSLEVGELDLGIFPDVFHSDDLETETLFGGLSMSALLPKGHPLAARKVVTPADVGEETLLLIPRAPNPAYHDGLRAHIEKGGYRFGQVAEVDGMTLRDTLFAVVEGRGICLAPPVLEPSEASMVAVRPLQPPLHMPDAIVAWRRDRPELLRHRLRGVRETARATRAGTPERDVVR